jgi:hypothetical protein
MSLPRDKASAEQSSVNVVRGLLERNLLERAVALAETRWPGSGPLVRLAHEWKDVSPAERRQRLSAIGPQELARMRALAEIQPDLARVLADLETRGILPPAPVEDVRKQPGSRKSLNASGVAEAPSGVVPNRPREPIVQPTPSPGQAQAHPRLTPLPQVSRPTLDLGLPSTSEFLELEVERRAQIVEQTQGILDRVRARIDESADRLHERRTTRETGVPGALELERTDATPIPPTSSESESTALAASRRSEKTRSGSGREETFENSARTSSLVERLSLEQVLEFDEYQVSPSWSELNSAARSMSLDLVELSPGQLSSREFWGGLVRAGRGAVPQAGLFPRSLSGHNLVVVRGRLSPRAVSRLREGFCDIPGTKATVQVCTHARILLMPN